MPQGCSNHMRPPSTIRDSWPGLAGTFLLLGLPVFAAADEASDSDGYRRYVAGNAADVVRPTSGLLVLQGGEQYDVDENYVRMGARGGGGLQKDLQVPPSDEANQLLTNGFVSSKYGIQGQDFNVLMSENTKFLTYTMCALHLSPKKGH